MGNHSDEIEHHDNHEEDNTFSGHHIDEENVKHIVLAPVELLSIDDGLSLLVNKNEFDGAVTLRPVYPTAGIGCSIDLLTKVGQAVLRMAEDIENPSMQSIEVNDVDLFILRELLIAQIVKVDRSIALGLRLKIYTLLYGETIAEEKLNDSLEKLLETSNKDGKLGTVLDGFKAEAEHEN